MAVLPQLADADRYQPCANDLRRDPERRAHWLAVFRDQIGLHLDHAARRGVEAARRTAAADALHAALDELEVEPGARGRLDVLSLCRLRNDVLWMHGIEDEFAEVKTRETERAMARLRERLAVIDGLAPAQRLESLAEGLLTGNMFDMGAPVLVEHFASDDADGADRAARHVPARPWHVDGLDDAAALLEEAPPSRVVVFVDNAGADVVLGVLPLARELAGRGSDVVLAANRRPCLNDVTAAELDAILHRAAAHDPVFTSSRIDVVDSGSGTPLIDLADLSDELVSAATGAELVVLLGMGRAIESNWEAQFTCPSWKIAMIKDENIARMVGGRLFDAVFRFAAPVPV